MVVKFFSICFVVGGLMMGPATHNAVAAATPITEAQLDDAKTFVEKVGNEIVQILVNKEKPMADRKETFRSVLKRDFDIPAIGRFVLASHWRTMTDGDKTEFLKLFENAIVDNYSAQFDNYNNETLVVRDGVLGKDGGAVVSSIINRHGGNKPLQVNWVVFFKKGQFRILDIKVEGVSMSITQRNDYKSIIQNSKIDGLLKALRAKHQQS